MKQNRKKQKVYIQKQNENAVKQEQKPSRKKYEKNENAGKQEDKNNGQDHEKQTYTIYSTPHLQHNLALLRFPRTEGYIRTVC